VAFQAGSAMVLARKDHTRLADTAEVARQLSDTGARIVGTVLNAF
jgi:Mrp family chromosome partitioning ATPase